VQWLCKQWNERFEIVRMVICPKFSLFEPWTLTLVLASAFPKKCNLNSPNTPATFCVWMLAKTFYFFRIATRLRLNHLSYENISISGGGRSGDRICPRSCGLAFHLDAKLCQLGPETEVSRRRKVSFSHFKTIRTVLNVINFLSRNN
jgi:hypothetical protein